MELSKYHKFSQSISDSDLGNNPDNRNDEPIAIRCHTYG